MLGRVRPCLLSDLVHNATNTADCTLKTTTKINTFLGLLIEHCQTGGNSSHTTIENHCISTDLTFLLLRSSNWTAKCKTFKNSHKNQCTPQPSFESFWLNDYACLWRHACIVQSVLEYHQTSFNLLIILLLFIRAAGLMRSHIYMCCIFFSFQNLQSLHKYASILSVFFAIFATNTALFKNYPNT